MNGLKRPDPDGNKQTDAATHAVWSSVIEPKIDFRKIFNRFTSWRAVAAQLEQSLARRSQGVFWSARK